MNHARRRRRSELVEDRSRYEHVVRDRHRGIGGDRRIDVLHDRVAELGSHLEERQVPRLVDVPPVVHMDDVRIEAGEDASDLEARRRARHHRYFHAPVPFPQRQRRGDELHLEAVAEVVMEIENELRRPAHPDVGDDVEDTRPVPQPEALLLIDLVDRRPRQAERSARIDEIRPDVQLPRPASVAIPDQSLAAKPRLGEPLRRCRNVGKRSCGP